MKKTQTLATDSLGIGESIVMGVAGAAPAFSVSAVTTTLVASVGVLAPASILYCGLLMFGITLAFMHLNKSCVNAGSSYAWVSQIFGRHIGFFAGWALLVSSAVFMVSGSIPAATTTLLLIAPDKVGNLNWVTFTAALWLTLISGVALKGIKPSSYIQILMTGTEIFVLIAIISAGLYQYIHHIHLPVHTLSFSWFSLRDFTPQLFATGALTSLFLFWGWDVTLNLSEETKNAKHAPGWGAFWSVIVTILLFASFLVVTLLVLSNDDIQHAGTNIVFAIADKLFPRPWSYLAILAVILSSIGTLETTIIQFTRTLFAEGRDRVLHTRYAKLHPSWNTPWVALLFIWLFGMLFLFLSSYFTTITVIIRDSVNAIGFQVAFYYSLTGFACAWHYRLKWKNTLDFIRYIIWPVLSAFFLIFVALYSIPTFDFITNMVGLGGIVIGIIPFLWNDRIHHKKTNKVFN